MSIELTEARGASKPDVGCETLQSVSVVERRRKSVLVIGGGIAGLSAAHELARNGYVVTVVDRNEVFQFNPTSI
jgi:heterodisulfide reductase subunit A-like polyferredoxin